MPNTQQSQAMAWDAAIGPQIAPAFDSEQALIGTVLFSDADRAAALADLRSDEFQDQTCRAVWRVLQGMHARGETIDPVTVAAHTSKRLQARLDAGFFFALASLRPTWVGWESEAKRIRDAARRRQLLELARSLETKAQDAEHDPVESAALAQADLLRLANVEPQDTVASLYELAQQPVDHGETLLGSGECRYLERGAVLLLAAPSGVGKSHLAAQAATAWACGRQAFGLVPYNDALRCMILQAENPPNDARTIAAGMFRGLQLTDADAELVNRNTRQVWLPGCTGQQLLARLRGLLAAWPADVVFLDPLAGFAHGDLTKPEVVQEFCRAGLGALAVQCRCALFVCHHVPKPNANKDKRKMGTYDHQYAGAGSADLVANWPRAVLTLEALDRGEFLMRAAKRRPPWQDHDGQQSWVLGIRHTESMVWETFEPPAEAKRRSQHTEPDLTAFTGQIVELFKECGPMKTRVYEERIMALGIKLRTARACVDLCLSDGLLVESRGLKNSKTVGLPGQAVQCGKETTNV